MGVCLNRIPLKKRVADNKKACRDIKEDNVHTVYEMISFSCNVVSQTTGWDVPVYQFSKIEILTESVWFAIMMENLPELGRIW